LENGVNLSAAQSGLITIINPETGSVLAMAATDDTFTPNPAISSLFEPGSIFKPLTLAMALDSQSIRPDYLCHLCHQPLVVNGHPINNWDNSFHPHSTIQDIIKNSDNIGISLISRQLGRDRFLAYFNRLHLASKTNIDLPQETKPLKKTFWSAVDLATASFGQGFALTQLQFLVAFNTLANQGYLVSPKIVQAIQSGNSTSPIKSPPSIQVFQANTTNQIKSILKYVVENGAVSRYKPANLEVCGKSGTAQVAINGIYTDTVTTASYVGFSPCHKPKFTMIVTLNGPKSSPWGSTTAAPIWFNLAKLANQIL
jgi:cell division protein FtsI/penicillin-binding protein 2